MNKTIGVLSTIINTVSLLIFAISTIIGTPYSAYLSSMFIAFSFVAMIASYSVYAKSNVSSARYCSLSFSVIYATIIILIYYAQISTVRTDNLTTQAAMILNYEKFGLFFNYNLLGYGIMALATFFVGLIIQIRTKTDQVLKVMLMFHGTFFIVCFTLPLLGIFNPNMENAALIGRVVLLIWCIYFIPIDLLSISYFIRQESKA